MARPAPRHDRDARPAATGSSRQVGRGGHDRLIVPHWERIRSVLDADVAYHAGLLAGGGARSLFGDLHPDLRWSAGKLLLADSDSGSGEGRVMLGPDGVVLMPSVFIWPEWSVKRATSTQTTLMYPARGAATVWEPICPRLVCRFPGPWPSGAASDREAAAEALLGAPRARQRRLLGRAVERRCGGGCLRAVVSGQPG